MELGVGLSRHPALRHDSILSGLVGLVTHLVSWLLTGDRDRARKHSGTAFALCEILTKWLFYGSILLTLLFVAFIVPFAIIMQLAELTLRALDAPNSSAPFVGVVGSIAVNALGLRLSLGGGKEKEQQG